VVTLEEVRPQVAVLTLHRPEVGNALDARLVDECVAVLDGVDRDNSIRVVVLTGAGEDFCTGVELPARGPTAGPGPDDSAPDDPAAALRLQERFAELLLRLRRIPQPVIAAVEGRACGAGFALTLLSDLRVASTTARFATQFASTGVSGADAGTSWALPRLIGASRASELVLTGRTFDAAEAERIGLLARVTEPGDACSGAVALADELCALSPFGVVMTKEVMWANLAAPSLEAAVHLENRTQILAARSGDFDEAVRAFAEKRRPDFRREAGSGSAGEGDPGH
jgi:enoyl-CoA hydratase/carnithine racemase